MLFKKATVVRITGDIPVTAEAIEALIEKRKFVPAREMEFERIGWVPPTQEEDAPLVFAQSNVYLMALKIQTKILPDSVVKEELRERLAARGAMGRKVRAKERQQMMDDIRFDLLPKAFSRYVRIMGYIDAQRREIVIGSASSAQVETFLSVLREDFGSLPVALLETDFPTQRRMTDWTKAQEAPSKVRFGQEISLLDHAEGGRGTFRKQDLHSEEILQCIDSGKLVDRIELKWNDYLSIVVDDRLVLRKIAPLDMFDDKFESGDDAASALDADLFLTSSALRKLLPELYKWFDVSDPGVGVQGDGEEEETDFAASDYSPPEEDEIGLYDEHLTEELAL